MILPKSEILYLRKNTRRIRNPSDVFQGIFLYIFFGNILDSEQYKQNIEIKIVQNVN